MSRLKKIALGLDKAIMIEQATEIIAAIEKLRDETNDVLDHARFLAEKCQAYKGPVGDSAASEIAEKYISQITGIVQDSGDFSLDKLKLQFENDITQLSGTNFVEKIDMQIKD